MKPSVDLDARTAAAIASGMLSVALADGDVHPRELEIIQGFRDAIPDDVDPNGVLIQDDATREVLVRSLLMVALADGRISDVEREVVVEICRTHGVSDEALEAAEDELRRAFLGHFAGASAFRDQALAIAAELGIPEDEAEKILGEG